MSLDCVYGHSPKSRLVSLVLLPFALSELGDIRDVVCDGWSDHPDSIADRRDAAPPSPATGGLFVGPSRSDARIGASSRNATRKDCPRAHEHPHRSPSPSSTDAHTAAQSGVLDYAPRSSAVGHEARVIPPVYRVLGHRCALRGSRAPARRYAQRFVSVVVCAPGPSPTYSVAGSTATWPTFPATAGLA